MSRSTYRSRADMVQEPTARYLRTSWIRRTPKKPRPSAPALRTSSTPTSRSWASYDRVVEDAFEVDRRLAAKLAANGLLTPSWPTEYGGGMSGFEQVILAEEFEKAGAPTGAGNGAFSIQMVGNTILHWGRGAESTLPAAHYQRDQCLVPGLLGARCWFRPRWAWLPGRPRRRRVGHQRSEDLDICRAVRQLDLRVVPLSIPMPRSIEASRSSCARWNSPRSRSGRSR